MFEFNSGLNYNYHQVFLESSVSKDSNHQISDHSCNTNRLITRVALKTPYSPKRMQDHEIATYLNKGQKYVFEQLCLSHHREHHLELKTIIKLEFFDKHFASRESEYFSNWITENKHPSLLNMDFYERDLCTKILKMDTIGSMWEVSWFSNLPSTVYICANFVGSDFEKRQGCEGALMTLKCETFQLIINPNQASVSLSESYITCCRFKVFKFKNGDRKLKQDMERYTKHGALIKDEIKKFSDTYKKLEECQQKLEMLEEQEKAEILEAFIIREEELNDILDVEALSYKIDKQGLKNEQQIVKNLIKWDEMCSQENIIEVENEILNYYQTEILHVKLETDDKLHEIEKEMIQQISTCEENQMNQIHEIQNEKVIKTINLNTKYMESLNNLEISELKNEASFGNHIYQANRDYHSRMTDLKVDFIENNITFENAFLQIKASSTQTIIDVDNKTVDGLKKLKNIENDCIIETNKFENEKSILESKLNSSTRSIEQEKKYLCNKKILSNKNHQLINENKILEHDKMIASLEMQKSNVILNENEFLTNLCAKKTCDELEYDKKTKKLTIEKEFKLQSLDNEIVNCSLDKNIKSFFINLKNDLKSHETECLTWDILIDSKIEKLDYLTKLEKDKQQMETKTKVGKTILCNENDLVKQKIDQIYAFNELDLIFESKTISNEHFVKQQLAESEKLLNILGTKKEVIAAETEKLIRCHKAEEEKVVAETEKVIRHHKAEEEKVFAEIDSMIKIQHAKEKNIIVSNIIEAKIIELEIDKLKKDKIAENQNIMIKTKLNKELLCHEIKHRNDLQNIELDCDLVTKKFNFEKEKVENKYFYKDSQIKGLQTLKNLENTSSCIEEMANINCINNIKISNAENEKDFTIKEFSAQESILRKEQYLNSQLIDNQITFHKKESEIQSEQIKNNIKLINVIKENDTNEHYNIISTDNENFIEQINGLDAQIFDQEVKYLEKSEQISNLNLEKIKTANSKIYQVQFELDADVKEFNVNRLNIEKEQKKLEHNINDSLLRYDQNQNDIENNCKEEILKAHTSQYLKAENIDLSKHQLNSWYESCSEKNDLNTAKDEILYQHKIEYQIDVIKSNANDKKDKLLNDSEFLKRKFNISSNVDLTNLDSHKLLNSNFYLDANKKTDKLYENEENYIRNDYFGVYNQIKDMKCQNLDYTIRKNKNCELKHQQILEEFKLKFENQKNQVINDLENIKMQTEASKMSLEVSMKSFEDTFVLPHNETVFQEPKKESDKQSIANVFFSDRHNYSKSIEPINNYQRGLFTPTKRKHIQRNSLQPNEKESKSVQKLNINETRIKFELHTFSNTMSNEELMRWLKFHRFNEALTILRNYNGFDLSNLSKYDIGQLLGHSEALRLFNLMQKNNLQSNIPNDKSIYVCLIGSNGEIVSQSGFNIDLQTVHVNELIDKLCEYIGMNRKYIANLFIFHQNTYIMLSKETNTNLIENNSSFLLKVEKEQYFEQLINMIMLPFLLI